MSLSKDFHTISMFFSESQIKTMHCWTQKIVCCSYTHKTLRLNSHKMPLNNNSRTSYRKTCDGQTCQGQPGRIKTKCCYRQRFTNIWIYKHLHWPWGDLLIYLNVLEMLRTNYNQKNESLNAGAHARRSGLYYCLDPLWINTTCTTRLRYELIWKVTFICTSFLNSHAPPDLSLWPIALWTRHEREEVTFPALLV